MLNYQVTGDNDKTIIFVHGNSQALQTWDYVIKEDALTNYSKIAVDLPGHGLSFHSAQPAVDYTLKGFAAQLMDFLKTLPDKEYILVGTSLGTNLIGELTPFPKNCKGVFLLAAMVASSDSQVGQIVQANPAANAAFTASPSDAEIDAFVSNALYINDSAKIAEYKREFTSTDPSVRSTLATSIGSRGWVDEIANLNAADIPIGVAYGKEEKLVVTDYLHSTDLKLWSDQIFSIDNAGHAAHVDQPDATANLIAKFAEATL